MLVWCCSVCVVLRAGVWWCYDNASASASVDDCVSCIDDDDDDDSCADDSGADDSGADDSCGHDDGAHYDGSVFGDVQGCKLLG